jgi:LysM domain-containing protein
LGGVGVVAVPARSWRPFAAPAAFLAAVTVAVVCFRVFWPHHHTASAPRVEHARTHHAKTLQRPLYYRVRAGDTLARIAARTKTPVARLQRLNPNVQPTALFIGQRLRLR